MPYPDLSFADISSAVVRQVGLLLSVQCSFLLVFIIHLSWNTGQLLEFLTRLLRIMPLLSINTCVGLISNISTDFLFLLDFSALNLSKSLLLISWVQVKLNLWDLVFLSSLVWLPIDWYCYKFLLGFYRICGQISLDVALVLLQASCGNVGMETLTNGLTWMRWCDC